MQHGTVPAGNQVSRVLHGQAGPESARGRTPDSLSRPALRAGIRPVRQSRCWPGSGPRGSGRATPRHSAAKVATRTRISFHDKRMACMGSWPKWSSSIRIDLVADMHEQHADAVSDHETCRPFTVDQDNAPGAPRHVVPCGTRETGHGEEHTPGGARRITEPDRAEETTADRGPPYGRQPVLRRRRVAPRPALRTAPPRSIRPGPRSSLRHRSPLR